MASTGRRRHWAGQCDLTAAQTRAFRTTSQDSALSRHFHRSMSACSLPSGMDVCDTSIFSKKPIRLSETGLASTKPTTLVQSLKNTVARHGEKGALYYKVGSEWKHYTWNDYYRLSCTFARAALSLGFQKKDAVAIIGFNSPEWILANVGAILAGGVSAGIYTTNTASVCSYIVQNAHATIIVCEGEAQLAKFLTKESTSGGAAGGAAGADASASSSSSSSSNSSSNVLAYVVYNWQQKSSKGGAAAAGAGDKAASFSFLTPDSLEEAKRKGVFTWEQFLSLGSSESATVELRPAADTGESSGAALSKSSSAGILPLAGGAASASSAPSSPMSLQSLLERRMSEQDPEEVVTLVYTSGTTGMPKAVMISHDNVNFIATSVLHEFSASPNERMVSYLPLSHIAAALLDIYGPLILGFSIYFAAPSALKGTLVVTLKEVKPTIFFGVPRVFEKIQDKMLEIGSQSGCVLRAISRWAKRIGTAASAAEEAGGAMPWGYSAANLLVFGNIRKALGFEECRALFSAAAPMQPETVSYFASLHLPINEAFGMSETCGPVTANLPERGRKTGTCGPTFPGLELAIMPIEGVADSAAATAASAAAATAAGTGVGATAAADSSSSSASAASSSSSLSPSSTAALLRSRLRPGLTPLPPNTEGEVCFRGRHIMVGYKDNVEETLKAFDADGWLHSGDLGRLDEHGRLTITGRAKELIKTAGGENIPPLLIENTVKEELRAVSNCVLIGDKQKYLVILLCLRTEMDKETGEATGTQLDKLALAAAQAAGSAAKTVQEAIADPAFSAYIEAGIQRANARAISNACRIQKWTILPRDLTVAGGELTATLKVKRSVVQSMYAEHIHALYAAGGGGE